MKIARNQHKHVASLGVLINKQYPLQNDVAIITSSVHHPSIIFKHTEMKIASFIY
jgi:hypothetical protein